MQIQLRAFIPGQVEDVFDFLDDPAKAIRLSEHAADHVMDFDVVEALDGRRTVDFRMRAGNRRWVQTVEQVVRDRPTRLVTRGWTWTENRADIVLEMTVDRHLTAASGGTQLTMTAAYRLGKPSLLGNARLWLQRGASRLELAHSLHLLVEYFTPPT